MTNKTNHWRYLFLTSFALLNESSLSCNPGDDIWNAKATDPSNSAFGKAYTCGELITSLQLEKLDRTEDEVRTEVANSFPTICGECGSQNYLSGFEHVEETCNDVWDLPAIGHDGTKSCGSRIAWLMDNDVKMEYEAKEIVAKMFPNVCGPCGKDSFVDKVNPMIQEHEDIAFERDENERFTEAADDSLLSKFILEDMLPPSSTKCKYRDPNRLSYSFTYSGENSHWDTTFTKSENDVFQAELEYKDRLSDRSWTMRIGHGGNIYSLRGPFGESVPPQCHKGAPWIDEVWQTVSVNIAKNKPPQNGYFIHQAGTYQKDSPYTDKPFYSPSILSHCNKEDKQCSFGSWGQQAHVPTNFTSDILYFNRYKDCGNGVIEYTSAVYNSGNTDEINYLNTPWGGTRASNLPEMMISNKSKEEIWQKPLQVFGASNNTIQKIRDTDGYSLFAQEIEPYVPKHFKLPTAESEAKFIFGENASSDDTKSVCETSNDSRVCLQVQRSNRCVEHKHVTKQYKKLCVMLFLKPTVEISSGFNGALEFINENTNAKITVDNVVLWSFRGNILLFCPIPGTTIRQVNNAFGANDYISVKPVDTSNNQADKTALALVHGDGDNAPSGPWRFAPSRIRFGRTGIQRDYNVFNLETLAHVRPGNIYVNRQYFIIDKYSGIRNRITPWNSEPYDDLLTIGDLPSRDITLYATNGTRERISSFGITLDNQHCAKGHIICRGKSTPSGSLHPLYVITCGTSSYVGADKYHFSDKGPNAPIRSYACRGQDPNARPTITLLGFFDDESCNPLRTAIYDASYCSSGITNSTTS